MKRVVCLISLLCMVVLLASCTQKDKKEEVSDKRSVASNINMDLVDKLVGDWDGDDTAGYNAVANYKISVSDGYVYFDERKLQITDTKDDTVFTQTDEDNPFYYDFRVKENKLEVFPSYPVPEGMNGGSLAPVNLIRKSSTDSTNQSSYEEEATFKTANEESTTTDTSAETTKEVPIELGTIFYQNLDLNDPI